MPGADGVLGPGVFSGATVTLDQRRRRLRVHGRGAAPPDPDREAVEVPFLSIGGTPFIPVQVDGVPMHAMIDTGASQAVLSPHGSRPTRSTSTPG